MRRALLASAAIVAGLVLAGCGSQDVATTPPPSAASSSATSSGGPIAYDQIDLTAWHDAMVRAGAPSDVDLQSVYATTVKLCAKSTDALSIHLATKGDQETEQVAFQYVCPSRMKAFKTASEIAD